MLKALDILNNDQRQEMIANLRLVDQGKYIAMLSSKSLGDFDLNKQCKNLPKIQYFLLFRFPANSEQILHIDCDEIYRKCSLNFLVEGKARVEIYHTSHPPTVKYSSSGIKLHECDINTATLICSAEASNEMLIKTDVPHRVIAETATTMLCARFVNNPSFQQVLDAVKSS